MRTVIIGFLCSSGGFFLGWLGRSFLRSDYVIGYDDGWRECMRKLLDEAHGEDPKG